MIPKTNLLDQIVKLRFVGFLIHIRSVVQKVLLLDSQIKGTLDTSGASSPHFGVRQGQSLFNVRFVLVEQILGAEAWEREITQP